MKILLTGVSGLVGSAYADSAIRRGHEVIGIYNKRKIDIPGLYERIAMDLTDFDQLTRLALDYFPDAIINAAAVSSPADVQADSARAEKINVGLPRHLAQLANHLNSRFIHLSSDMVFDGKTGNYRSTDIPGPVNLYGEQKLEAERVVLRAAAEFSVVLRITIVMGNSPYGRRSLHEKLFEQWSEGKKTPLFNDEIRQPCSADNVAEVMVELTERNDLSGLFHWAGGETVSRYEIGKRILEQFNLPEELIEESSLSAIEDQGARPENLSFNLNPLVSKLKTQPESISQQLDRLIVPLPYRDWYHAL